MIVGSPPSLFAVSYSSVPMRLTLAWLGVGPSGALCRGMFPCGAAFEEHLDRLITAKVAAEINRWKRWRIRQSKRPGCNC
jgi:hypothetical protein